MTHSFWQHKRVLLTGHTGFKGTWATLWLQSMGAKVTGLSLPGTPDDDLFSILRPWENLTHLEADIRHQDEVERVLAGCEFDIVIHMAAQALVRRSYRSPLETFATNVMGTLHVLDTVCKAPHKPKIILVITSDKVYRNHETSEPFVEDDPLGGDDPYSASKACAEIACHSFRQSFLAKSDTILATARGGNVIGGGDFAEDRLIPDFIRAVVGGDKFHLRHPESTRPWQHVLDVVAGYLTYAESLASNHSLPLSLNFGPDSSGCWTTGNLINQLQKDLGTDIPIICSPPADGLKEKSSLMLDTSATMRALSFQPRLDTEQTIRWTAEWYRAWREGANMRHISLTQLSHYKELQPCSAAVSVAHR